MGEYVISRLGSNVLTGMTLKTAGNFFPDNDEARIKNTKKVLGLIERPYLLDETIIMCAAHSNKIFSSNGDKKSGLLHYRCDGIIYSGKGAAICFPGGCPIVAFHDVNANISGILHGSWKAVSLNIVEGFLRQWTLMGGKPKTTMIYFLPATCDVGLTFDNIYFRNIMRVMPYNISSFIRKTKDNYISFSLHLLLENALNEYGYAAKVNRECVCCGDRFWFYRDDRNEIKYRNAAFIISG